MDPMKSLYRLVSLCGATLVLAAFGGAAGAQTWFFPDGAALTGGQSASFDAQWLYFNVHSATNPGGEIRGQIIPSSPGFVTDAGTPSTSNTFSALLSGDQEVPVNASQASGYGTVVFDPIAKALSGVLVTGNIAGTVAHIHNGLPGVSGPVAIPLTGGPTVWTVPAGTVLTDAQISDLAAGAYYFNVHTTAAPGGEIRGQLTQQLRFVALSGANEVPAVPTAASGAGMLAFNPATGQIGGFVQTRGIAGSAAHIHEAAAGTNGGVIVPLAEAPAGSGRWVVPAGSTLTAAQASSFNTDGLYVNVHSASYPGGEIRGQALAATLKIGNASLDGTQEVPPVATAASGTGIMVLNSVTGLANGNVSATLIDGTQAHVHEGAAGVNGPVVIPLTLAPPPSTLPSPLGVSAMLADGVAGSAYDQSLIATGGTAPYTWAVAGGALPDGLNLSADGTIGGTPATAGSASFTVSVTDSASPAAMATLALTLNVAAAPAATVSYSAQVQPIFTARCAGACHSPGRIAPDLTAGNSYASLVQGAAPAVTPRSSATSRLYLRVSGATAGLQMPLVGPPLSVADQTLIRNWIDQGAVNN